MKILKIILFIIAAVIAALLLFLGIFTLMEYKPADKTTLGLIEENSAAAAAPKKLRFLSWNMGYFGLGHEVDFFLEGGSQKGRTPRKRQQESLNNMVTLIRSVNPDICFLQEIDRGSFRTYKHDQAKEIASLFNNYAVSHAQNYKCAFVPSPLSSPIGKVDSGVLTMSQYQTRENVRMKLPGQFSWPTRIFHLKRCILLSVIPSPTDGKDWYLLNIHLSAYDNGDMRKQQLAFLKELMMSLYTEGHYVVVGGDWNSQFPGISKESFGSYTTPEESLFWLQDLPDEWAPQNWQWGYASDIPTSRTLEKPYQKGENFTTVIDGFIVSPNLQIDMIQGMDLGFKDSDHNPVLAEISIRE